MAKRKGWVTVPFEARWYADGSFGNGAIWLGRVYPVGDPVTFTAECRPIVAGRGMQYFRGRTTREDAMDAVMDYWGVRHVTRKAAVYGEGGTNAS